MNYRTFTILFDLWQEMFQSITKRWQVNEKLTLFSGNNLLVKLREQDN